MQIFFILKLFCLANFALTVSFYGYHILKSSPALQSNVQNRFCNLLLRRIFETFSLLRSWILHRTSVLTPLQRDVEEQLRLACRCVFSSLFFSPSCFLSRVTGYFIGTVFGKHSYQENSSHCP